jgi:hypothetical protein
MKLAEALAQRAGATRRAEQLRVRIVGNARYQEGESPAEDAGRLLVEVGAVLDELGDADPADQPNQRCGHCGRCGYVDRRAGPPRRAAAAPRGADRGWTEVNRR